MTTTNRDMLHPVDATLVRYLDEELAPQRRLAVLEHVAACRGCAERLEELDDASAWLHDHVAVLDEGLEPDERNRVRAISIARRAHAGQTAAVAPQAASYSTRVLRIAAAIGFVALVGFSVEPLSAWIAARVGIVAEPAEVVSPEVVEAPVVEVSPTVSFTPDAAVFRIEVAAHQQMGTLSIELTDSPMASAQVLDGPDAAILVLPAGLRIENAAESRGSYRILLPARLVERVEVYEGTSLIAEENFGGEVTGTTIDLAEAASR